MNAHVSLSQADAGVSPTAILPAPVNPGTLEEQNIYLKEALVLAQLAAAAKDKAHGARVDDLLEANNRLLNRARDAERRAGSALAALNRIADLGVRVDAADQEVTSAEMTEIAEDALAETRQVDDGDVLRFAVNILVAASHGAATEAGWWTDLHTGESLIGKRNVGEMLMLAVSEIAEAMEGHRKGLRDDKLPHRPMIEVEIADCLIRLTDTAGALGLDLGGALAEKMAFNATRADHKPENRRKAGGKAY